MAVRPPGARFSTPTPFSALAPLSAAGWLLAVSVGPSPLVIAPRELTLPACPGESPEPPVAGESAQAGARTTTAVNQAVVVFLTDAGAAPYVVLVVMKSLLGSRSGGAASGAPPENAPVAAPDAGCSRATDGWRSASAASCLRLGNERGLCADFGRTFSTDGVPLQGQLPVSM